MTSLPQKDYLQSMKLQMRPHKDILKFYSNKGWEPFEFQLQSWLHVYKGHSGLINAPTGMGKTYAAWLGILNKIKASNNTSSGADIAKHKKLKVLWITPLRALSSDIAKALQDAVEGTGLEWQVELRSGDTSSSVKKRQLQKPPECIVTTPESLHLLLSYSHSSKYFSELDFIIVDEWHEMVGTKRGTLIELALSRLKAIRAAHQGQLQIWGISATIGNLDTAMKALLGDTHSYYSRLIKAQDTHKTIINTIYPDVIEKYSWAGHIGTRLARKLLPIIESSKSTLIFANTRGQTEIWYRELLKVDPSLTGKLAIHHGSMSKEARSWVEQALAAGKLKAVIATSSLDLGIDFHPVKTVIQIGSPKSVSRFLQRAGRSGHQPGQTSTVHFLPTYTLELIDIAGLKAAIAGGEVEPRLPPTSPYDVLIQYLVTLACGDGFSPSQAFREIKGCYSYRQLQRAEFDHIVDFIHTGGKSLHAYDEYKRFVYDSDKDMFKIASPYLARLHRANIGVIVSAPSLKVKFKNGQYISTIEESFLAKLPKGENFWLGGRNLELVRITDDGAIVTLSKKSKGRMAKWLGSRMQLTSEMAHHMEMELGATARLIRSGYPNTQKIGTDMQKLLPTLKIQQQRSIVPMATELLVEQFKSREGYHLFIFPFAGRALNEGLGTLIAYRVSKSEQMTFSLAMNDFGFELLSNEPINITPKSFKHLLNLENLDSDLEQSVNISEIAQRQFREVARIAGLIDQSYPGEVRRLRHLQAQANLLYQVFSQYDPENVLLKQAFKQVRQEQLQLDNIRQLLTKLNSKSIVLTKPEKFTPLAFPILVDRLRQKLTNEELESRVAKILNR